MSDPTNDQVAERDHEIGYDKGYADCESELKLKIKTALPYILMKFCDPKPEHSGLYASDLTDKIVKDVFGG